MKLNKRKSFLSGNWGLGVQPKLCLIFKFIVICNLCNSSTFISLPLRYLRTLLSASLKTSKFWKPTLVHHYLVKVRTSFFHKVKQKIETVITHFHDMICSWSINKMNTLVRLYIFRCFQINYFSTDFRKMITFCKYNKTSNQLSKCLKLIYYLDTRKL